ncbi:hypothetical protein D1871_05590 [Nakamurella silvestris]|nr:hypothetical protein D1871_05590 [Nakamurella silvestris]
MTSSTPKLWARRIAGGAALPFLALAGWVRTTIFGQPDEPDNWLARKMAWAIEPFRRAPQN